MRPSAARALSALMVLFTRVSAVFALVETPGIMVSKRALIWAARALFTHVDACMENAD